VAAAGAPISIPERRLPRPADMSEIRLDALIFSRHPLSSIAHNAARQHQTSANRTRASRRHAVIHVAQLATLNFCQTWLSSPRSADRPSASCCAWELPACRKRYRSCVRLKRLGPHIIGSPQSFLRSKALSAWHRVWRVHHHDEPVPV
jgi:hypothetical protein